MRVTVLILEKMGGYMGARGSLGKGELDSVGLDLRIPKVWQAGHYDRNMSDREIFGPP